MTYVWAAYSITWIFIFIYTLVLGGRQRRLMHEIASLQAAVQKRTAGKQY